MSENIKTPKEVIYTFEKLDGYRVVPVDGAWGGINYRKAIRVELFTEVPIATEKIKYKLNNNNVLGDEIERIPKVNDDVIEITRQIHTALVMTPEVARTIAEWLLKRCEEAGGK